MAFRYDPAATRRLVLDRVVAGQTLKAACAGAGMPSADSVRGWARKDAGFAAELAEARRRGEWLRRFAYDEAKGAALIARLAAGARLADVLCEPGMPSWRTYTYWRRTHMHFGSLLGEARAAREAARLRGLRGRYRPFDAAVGDAIYVRLWKGETLRAVLRSEARFPSLAVLARWRRETPEFDAMLRFVMEAWRAKGRPRVALTQALRERVLDGLVLGGSLRSLAAEPGMPCQATLYRWVRERPDFAAQVARACVDREDWYMDQVWAIAEAATPGTVGLARKAMAPYRAQLARLGKRPGWKRAAR